MSATVFITGATGFIAQYTIKLLLEKNYKVVGTVRSQEKGDKLSKLLNNPKFEYEIVPNLITKGAFDESFNHHPDIKYILHVASPIDLFHASSNLEEEIIIPAVQGTINLLETVQEKLPNLERFVYTSSVIAIAPLQEPNQMKTKYTYEDWNGITKGDCNKSTFHAYSASKTWAEQAAWDFVSKENPNFKLTTVNPSYVFGPQLFDDYVSTDLNFSNELIQDLLSTKVGDKKDFGKEYKEFVHVEDVAKLLVIAFEQKGATGKRLIANAAGVTDQTILNIINGNFPEYKGKIAVGDITNTSVLEKSLDLLFDTSDTIEVTGFRFESSIQPIVISVLKQALKVQKK